MPFHYLEQNMESPQHTGDQAPFETVLFSGWIVKEGLLANKVMRQFFRDIRGTIHIDQHRRGGTTNN